MNERTKKILRNILFLLMIPLVISIFVFSNYKAKEDVCSGVKINFTNNEQKFVTEEDVKLALQVNSIVANKIKIKDIKIKELENEFSKNPWVKENSIFVDADHHLNITITQHQPVLRIMQNDSSSNTYYLDSNANPILTSTKYTANVPVVSARKLGYRSADLNIKNDLVRLATFIAADSFWNAMIGQIILLPNNEIDIVPQLGNHILKFGVIDNGMKEKFSRILTFYQQEFKKLNWDGYNEIDARFAKQIVCRNTNLVSLPEVDNTKKQTTKHNVATNTHATNAHTTNKKIVLAKPVQKNKTIAKQVTNKIKNSKTH